MGISKFQGSSALDTHPGSKAYEHVTLETRRRMLAVRGRDTAPELRVRHLPHSMGYRFRLHRKDLPGTPDIVLPRHRKIVLVHGCFWHGHEDCKRATRPVNNASTWAAKIVRATADETNGTWTPSAR